MRTVKRQTSQTGKTTFTCSFKLSSVQVLDASKRDGVLRNCSLRFCEWGSILTRLGLTSGKFVLILSLIRPQTLVGKAVRFTHELSFFTYLIFSSIHCSAQQQPSGWPSNVFRGSVVGKASIIGIKISPTPHLIITGWPKSAKFGIVFNIIQLWAAAFENSERYPNSETNGWFILCTKFTFKGTFPTNYLCTVKHADQWMPYNFAADIFRTK